MNDLAYELHQCARYGKSPSKELIARAFLVIHGLTMEPYNASYDSSLLDWLQSEFEAGRVLLIINGLPKGEGRTVRGAITNAMELSRPKDRS